MAFFRMLLLLIILPFGVLWESLRRKEDEREEPAEELRLGEQDPEFRHDDQRRLWMFDLSPYDRVVCVQGWFASQAAQVEPSKPFAVWVAEREAMRRKAGR